MAVELNIKTKVDISDAKKGTDEVEKGAKSAGSAIDQMTGALDKFTGGAVTAFKSFTSGVKSGITSLTTFKGVLAATGIGALVVAVGSLVAYFTKTERGAEALRVIMATLSGVVGAFTDKAVALGESIYEAFNNPKQALEDLGDSFTYYFTEFIPNAVQKVIDGLGLLGNAIGLLFKGKFSEAADVAAEGFTKVADGITDINPLTAILKEVAEEVVEIGKQAIISGNAAGNLEKRLNALKKAERDLAVETANRRAEIKELNKEAEDTNKTYEERASAAQKASDIESNLLAKRVQLAKENVAIIREQNALSESSEEDIQKLADAEIALANIRAESLEMQTTLQNKLNTLKQQQDAEIATDKENKRLEKLKEEDNALREYKLENDEATLAALLEFEQRKRDLELEQTNLTEAEKEAIRLSYLEKEAAANKQASDNKEKQDAKELADAEALSNAKVGFANQVSGLVAAIAGKDSKIAKGVAVGQATISGIQGVQNAFTTASASPLNAIIPGYAAIQAGIAGAFSALQIKQILSTNPSKGGGSPSAASRGVSGGTSAAQQQALPSFDFINQGVGGTQNAGFRNKAYVVSQDIKDEAALDARITDLSRA